MAKTKIDISKLSKINFSNLAEGLSNAKKFGKQHLPTILTVAGLGLSLLSKYLTAKEAVNVNYALKAEEEKRQREAEENGTEPVEITRWEKVKTYVEYCWPSMAAEAGSIVCIGISDRIDLKLLMTMTGLYHGSKSELMDLRNRVVDRDGKTALHHMDHDRRKEKWNPERDLDPSGIWETGKGNTLFVDLYTGAQFHSSISYINTAITELNTQLQESQGYGEAGYVELTDFLELLGENSRQRKCGRSACFRYNSPRDVIHPNQIIDWMDYVDPTTGEPRVAFIDYERFLTPSDDFVEKRPY